MTDGARRLISSASDVARFRGAQQLELLDVAIAFALDSTRTPGEALYPDTQESPTPQMLSFSPDLQSAFPTGEALDVHHLRRACQPAFKRLRRQLHG